MGMLSPVGASKDFLAVNDHEFFFNLSCKLFPTSGAVRVPTNSADSHVLEREREREREKQHRVQRMRN